LLLFVTFWGCLGFFVAVWGFWYFLGLRLFLFCWFAGAFAVLVCVLGGACLVGRLFALRVRVRAVGGV